MTLDELKAEAKRQGYKLVKNTKLPKILPCVCGTYPIEIHSRSLKKYCYECGKCLKPSLWGNTKLEGIENWNRMVTDEAGRTDERP